MTRNPITDGETVLAPLFGSLSNAHSQDGILNGVVPSVGTGDWDVDVGSGNAVIDSDPVSVSSTTVTLTTPANDADLDSGEFRVDLVTVDSGGTVNVAEGAAATQPISPDISDDEAVVCAVVVSGDAAALQSADIRDYRIIINQDARTYKDNDIDSDGDGRVDDTDAVQGESPPFFVTHTINTTNIAAGFTRTITLTNGFVDGFRLVTNAGDGTNNMSVTITYDDSTTNTFSIIADTSLTVESWEANKDGRTVTQVDISANANNPSTVGDLFFTAVGY